jgi:hypothetical protein
MARGVYTVVFDQQTILSASGDYDFFEFDAGTEKPIELVALFIGNKSQVGDALEQMVAWSIVRGNTTTGNGASTTPRLTDGSDNPTASFTAKVVSSTPASAGTPVTLHADTFNIRTGLQLIFPELMRHKTQAADLLCVRLLTALTVNAVISGTAYVREL